MFMTQRPRSVAHEIHQTRPFQSAGHEAVVTLGRTAAMIDRHFASVFEVAGLTGTQYNVLRILRGAGTEGLPTLAIRDRLVDLSPGITRLIDRLEAADLATRVRDADDRRQVTVRITPAGLALLKTLDAPVDAAERAVVATLTAAEQRTLVRVLDQVRAGIADPATDL
jgi:DNA-binding MarR family transcriptional regulator